MLRNLITDAVVLFVSPSGENNRSVCVFSRELGIVYAILYGGPKSKLRGLVSPFNRGKMYLYRDTVKNSVKITDFDVTNFHQTFRESLFKSWAASLASEIVIKTKCGGSAGECWKIFNGFLDGIELSDEDSGRLGLVRFLWRYLELLGIRPDTSFCASCGKAFFSHTADSGSEHGKSNPAEHGSSGRTEYSRMEIAELTQTAAIYMPSENGFLCVSCSAPDKRGFRLCKQALHYLTAVSELEPKEVRSLQCTAKAANEMRDLTFYMIEAAAGQRLKSIESGLGIL
ncbi:DNA repair protein RecO [Treponema parvum]|uniref:DNA repair protein RecO n=1 Tax=Treponema parvum TaxID=138851 RepID=A0A975F086_9SPIR|nr:DNA repair protein RecO [Treponema parvum]QTQ11679.1 DNA repair protein RecO [Treponema parvum]QTQ16377.1 DNA repair protein RecO [Treponema parvum]